MITIVTPTFNRGDLLPRLYKSLQSQTDHGFEWIIVDDGSTDMTPTICSHFLDEQLFPVMFLRQHHSGKHVAINRASGVAHGDWFFIVDSDDYLPEDSISLNKQYLDQIKDNDHFAGVSGLCVDPQGNLLLPPGMELSNLSKTVRNNLGQEYIDATSQEYRDHFKMPGDRAEIVRTDLIKRYPFPHFSGETFLSEYYLWQSISDAGLKLRWFNKPTYIAQYRAGGLTRTMDSVMRSNPLGRSFSENFALQSKASIKTKLRAAINYTRYGRFGGKTIRQLYRGAYRRDLFLLGVFPALLLPVRGGRK